MRVLPRHDLGAAKRDVCADVDARARELVALARAIHRRPETAFEERWASATLASILESAGFRVERGAFGLPTAFRAATGDARRSPVVICCEYDALPGIGHACGHNVIAAAGVGAGLALVGPARRHRRHVVVLGTPAEERGGGKILLARRGAFRGASAVMLVHPATEDVVTPALRAAIGVEVVFHGRAAHAAMAPERGRNALDAAVVAHSAIAALRSRLAMGEHVAATMGASGPPNIVPARVTSQFIVRAPDLTAARHLARQVCESCARAAATLGCRTTAGPLGPEYDGLRADVDLATAFTANAARLGRRMRTGRAEEVHRAGSTDLGVVSHLAPTIHPKIKIAPRDAPQHTTAFRHHAASPAADAAVLVGAKAMAIAALDLWLAPPFDRPRCPEEAPWRRS